MPPIQKILFGSPGTGKSYKVREIAQQELDITYDEASGILENTVKTVFHPEYTHADFMGKLMPLTQGEKVTYKFYAGHFLQVLGEAYKSIINGETASYLLVIDELNRGNASAIFGSIFQLLDREDDGWSSYDIQLSDMELYALLEITLSSELFIESNGLEVRNEKGNRVTINNFWDEKIYQYRKAPPENELDSQVIKDAGRLITLLRRHKISLPPNLSILCTINTSDESIYYLDSAFKRRWDWEYIDIPTDGYLSDLPSELFGTMLVINGHEKGLWINILQALMNS
ncbi:MULTISPECIES: GTPase subunit of Type II restriction endonuclease [Cyanophyceae]|uniref:GTPase subunit of Type II restriction endonuclease n=1 Tax=Cyanophyceae TaxID=3028117 RepID=UPI00016DC6B0|nr:MULTISPECIES: GTPase subunit of Type II restriction endonuclease [Cyanophyceae]ACA99074.1 GTPase subunit of Type II restriction endonuclease [Picosynechococcus sp. PCC 7002]SMH35177.1 hypothetical protein SAMN06272755_0647 [Picosynechococcus sp. OG1]